MISGKTTHDKIREGSQEGGERVLGQLRRPRSAGDEMTRFGQ